ncbi:ROK family transcriptional regulator [Pseudovibrio sp. Tun.PSC04-5.I4]|uniref:ROK family transcriptional regulator n=1 Tax=Pseudovibrio sp. Tun.PSC04-5.I4 TaxID=1798213 RepID=UPI000882BCD5|nr:ROK family transcriptional regulator [Pseudovibrio sp. Tun.PSC04-5.I4]SDR13892.1 Sugar kinase of the NBD/HSP70 family, may contain an N-terminal HTH domain [Pseudovibrio sp. Tun.PSC04-5.I4]
MHRKTALRIIGSNAERTRLHNRKVVLGHLRSHGKLGRAELARLTGLSTQAMSNIIAELESEGLILAGERQAKGRGLPAVQYTLNPDGAVGLGIEVRPSAILCALVNFLGDTIYSKRIHIESSEPDVVLPVVKAACDEALASLGTKAPPVLGAGVVMPGPFGRVGLTGAGKAELVGWDDKDPQTLFEDLLQVPVRVENDATAAAIAEQTTGSATELHSFCFVYFGTGLGLGIISNGEIIRGAFGNAGELGHVVVERGGRLCSCGNRGCLETYTSRLAASDFLQKRGKSADSQKDLSDLLAAGDADLEEWICEAAGPLAQAISTLENLFDPEAVILGGAMPPELLERLITKMDLIDATVSVRDDRKLPRVVRGASGWMTAALGAAALIIHDTYIPSISKVA